MPARARRSRGTTASRAGARSASGRARSWARCSTLAGVRDRRALHRLPLRRPRSAAHALLRVDRPGRRLPPADDPGAGDERPAAWRSATARPSRLRVERQLGYKHAKYLMGIEAVATLDGIGLRQGRLLGRSRTITTGMPASDTVAVAMALIDFFLARAVKRGDADRDPPRRQARRRFGTPDPALPPASRCRFTDKAARARDRRRPALGRGRDVHGRAAGDRAGRRAGPRRRC